jgi:hypothetical protein
MNANPTPPPRVGIWRAIASLGDYKFKHLVWPEGLLSVLFGVGGSVALMRATAVNDRVDAIGELTGVSAALLAIVFTALAIVVSLPSSRYLRMLEETTGGGIQRFLDPFLVAVGVQLVLVIGTMGYRLGAEHVPWRVEHAGFYVIGFLFVYGALDIAGLARSLVRHGVYRARDAAAAGDDESAARVTHLDQQRRR